MKYDTAPRPANVTARNAAAAFRPVDQPLDEKIARTQKPCIATICLLRSESPESVVRKFKVESGQEEQLFNVGLYQRQGDVILKYPEQVALVAIDQEDRVVLLRNQNRKKITLAERGETVRVGTGRYRLYLERIEERSVADNHGLPAPQAAEPGRDEAPPSDGSRDADRGAPSSRVRCRPGKTDWD